MRLGFPFLPQEYLPKFMKEQARLKTEKLKFHCSLNTIHAQISCYLTHYPMHPNTSFMLNQVLLVESSTELPFYPYTNEKYIIYPALQKESICL